MFVYVFLYLILWSDAGFSRMLHANKNNLMGGKRHTTHQGLIEPDEDALETNTMESVVSEDGEESVSTEGGEDMSAKVDMLTAKVTELSATVQELHTKLEKVSSEDDEEEEEEEEVSEPTTEDGTDVEVVLQDCIDSSEVADNATRKEKFIQYTIIFKEGSSRIKKVRDELIGDGGSDRRQRNLYVVFERAHVPPSQ